MRTSIRTFMLVLFVAAEGQAAAPKPNQEAAAPQVHATATTTSVPASNIALQVPTKLEPQLTELASAATKLINQKAKPESIDFVDLLGKLAGAAATLIGAYLAIKASKKSSWWQENRALATTGLIAGATIVLAYIFSSFAIAVLHTLIALLVLVITITVAVAQLSKLSNEGTASATTPSDEASEEPVWTWQDEGKHTLDIYQNRLSLFNYYQNDFGKEKFDINGSLVDGFDHASIILEPTESVFPHWKIINEYLLVPVAIKVWLHNGQHRYVAEIVNIQPGLAVIRENSELSYRKLNHELDDVVRAAGIALIDSERAKLNAHKEAAAA